MHDQGFWLGICPGVWLVYGKSNDDENAGVTSQGYGGALFREEHQEIFRNRCTALLLKLGSGC